MPAIIEQYITGLPAQHTILMPGEVIALATYNPVADTESVVMFKCDTYDRICEVFEFDAPEADDFEHQDPIELMQHCGNKTQVAAIGHEDEYLMSTQTAEHRTLKLGVVHRLLMSPDFYLPIEA